MRPCDHAMARRLREALRRVQRTGPKLPGISTADAESSLLEQLVESVRRVKYVDVLLGRDPNPLRADPRSDLFDPLRGAILRMRAGEVEEAFWLIFLFVHFGRHRVAGWRYAREVYGGQAGALWTWAAVSADPRRFRRWLRTNEDRIRAIGGPHGFGNHRKYVSLSAESDTGTGAAVESYIQWTGKSRSHVETVDTAIREAERDCARAFDILFRSMKSVVTFGRLGRFDYLCMLSKLGLAGIKPGSLYLAGATGPLTGARMLLGDLKLSAQDANARILEIDRHLLLGPQILEDALCNWQKSPKSFKPFRG